MLIGRFLTDFADMVANWSTWATDVVTDWPPDGAPREPDWDTLRTVAARIIEHTA